MTDLAFVRGPVTQGDKQQLDRLVEHKTSEIFKPAGLVFAAVVRRGLKSVAKYPLHYSEIVGALK